MFYNMPMRIAKTICITLPPDLLKKAHKLAAREHRTMSELFREALRHYMTEGARNEQIAELRVPDETPAASSVIHSFRMEKIGK
ncbi:MAG: ribbon-helix-helix protein, CopG family [Candidatus Acidiferrales bacterium]